MTLAIVAYYLFTVFNGLRIFSYLPQIRKVALDTNGASAISYLTWGLWTAANASTGLYAYTNLGDLMLSGVNTLNTVCCVTVISLTAVKRHRFRRCCREAEQPMIAVS